MTLSLSIIKSPSGVSLTSSSKTFDEQGGTIGRGDSNSWVLADPDRFLSSRHCEVSCEGGMYFLTDTSTNGTFINGAAEPIGKGGRVPLNNGDTIDLGDYQFQASIGGAPTAAVAPLDNFDDPFESAAPAAPAAPVDDPFSTTTPQEDYFSSSFGSSDSGLSLGPSSAETDPLAALDKSSGVSDFDKPAAGGMGLDDDPFGLGSPAPSSEFGGAASNAGGFGSGGAIGDDDFFGGGSQNDNVDPMAQSVDWPEPKADVGGSAIPEDWDDDFLSPSASPDSAPLSPPPQVKAPPIDDPLFGDNSGLGDASGFGDNSGLGGSDAGLGEGLGGAPNLGGDDDFDSLGAISGDMSKRGVHKSLPLTDPPKMPDADPMSGADDLGLDGLLNERSPDPVDDFMAKPGPRSETRLERAVSRNTEKPQAKPQPKAAPKPRASVTAASNGGEQILLEGMGLTDKNLSPEQVEYILSTLGELMPVIINGMMQVLRSRASIKNEFRMNVTTIQPVENNPLKFSVNEEDAIENLFVKRTSAYKQPLEAFQEGFDTIGEHQVAIIAGIRAGFKSLMDRFNPEQLEKQFDRQNKGVVIPGMQKAKYWNSYRDYYEGFIGNMENSFQYLFGDEFVQAYEEQLRKLAVERRRNKDH